MVLRCVARVAVVAGGCVFVTLRGKLPVSAFIVVGHLRCVADTAIDPSHDRFTRPLVSGIRVAVTLSATRTGVSRSGVHGRIDEERDRLAIPRHCQIFFSVTRKTVRVGKSRVVENLTDFVRLVAIGAGRD